MTTQPKLFLGIPSGNGWMVCAGAQAAYLSHGWPGALCVQYQYGSLLAHVFNLLWASALELYHQGKVTHFCMLHNDIDPGQGWLATLVDELERTEATVLSAVVAVKDQHGYTSTATGNPLDPYDFRRITTTELAQLPRTFSIHETRRLGWVRPDDCLLVNTGCWITDLRWQGWPQRRNPLGVHAAFQFHVDDRIQYGEDGRLFVESAPEDWNMSRYVARQGGKVMATQKVQCLHFSAGQWGTRPAWGAATDTEAENWRRQHGRTELVRP